MKRWADDLNALLALLIVAAVVALLVVPVVMTVVASFDGRNFMGPFPPKDLSFRWYTKLFNDNRYLIGVRTTMLVTFPAALVATVVGVAAAIAIDRGRFPGKEFINSLFLSPVIVPGVVIGFSLLLFLAKLGVSNGLTRLLFSGAVSRKRPWSWALTNGRPFGPSPSRWRRPESFRVSSSPSRSPWTTSLSAPFSATRRTTRSRSRSSAI